MKTTPKPRATKKSKADCVVLPPDFDAAELDAAGGAVVVGDEGWVSNELCPDPSARADRLTTSTIT